jgi:NhaP-type Na+/H+ or K+/H+ antiporter
MSSFETTAGVLGVLLMVGALLSGLARRSILSLAALFALAGLLLGSGGLRVLRFDTHPGFVEALATVVLIVLLFRDGLEVEREFVLTHWRLPLRKLVVGMPITAAIIALVARLVADLPWTEAFLIGALLSPTDPVLSASVVSDRRVPALVRHSLNLESGLNDGLALPAVLALAAALDRQADPHFVWWQFALQDLGLGLVFGVVCGLVAAWVMPGSRAGPSAGIPDHQKALFGLGTAFATYSATVLPPHGNGLIAVFVAASVIGIRRPDLRAPLADGGAEIAEIAKLGIFAVFGSLLTLRGLVGGGWSAVAIAAGTFLLARPAGIWVALAGTSLRAPAKAFIAWFGPKGVATIAFSVLLLERHITDAQRLYDITALVVFASIILHGLTDTLGARWIAARGAVAARDGRSARAVASG